MAATTTHLQRTEGVRRQSALVAARILAITNETPTVRRFWLGQLQTSSDQQAPPDSSAPTTAPDEEGFDFRPGQWLDCFLPGVEVVGGYSICSGRRQYARQGVVELAVKYSTHPPALWMHAKAQVGNIIHMRVGGEFVMEEEIAKKKRLLFVAGGVGINPLISMLREWHDIGKESDAAEPDRRAALLYSARDQSELAFRKEIQEIAETDGKFSVKYFLTKEETTEHGMEKGRIGPPKLRRAVDQLLADKPPASSSDEESPLSSVEAYICGPKAMIDDCVATLRSIGLHQRQIHYESWW